MPTYEYRCEDCKKEFVEVSSMAEHVKAKVKCPKCSSRNVRRIFSAVALKTSKKS